jgi:glycosidase
LISSAGVSRYGGTLKGVASRLAYLRDMGVTAVWLTPIHPSPSVHGYDISDYFSVHPDVGMGPMAGLARSVNFQE